MSLAKFCMLVIYFKITTYINHTLSFLLKGLHPYIQFRLIVIALGLEIMGWNQDWEHQRFIVVKKILGSSVITSAQVYKLDMCELQAYAVVPRVWLGETVLEPAGVSESILLLLLAKTSERGLLIWPPTISEAISRTCIFFYCFFQNHFVTFKLLILYWSTD